LIDTPPKPFRSLGSNLFHPAFLLALLVLLVNDKVLKQRSPSLITGKLSDFAGLFTFPIFLASLLEIGTRRYTSLRVMTGITCLIAVAFIGMKTNESVSDFIGDVWFQLLRPIRSITSGSTKPVTFIRDTSDLVSLISIPLAFWFWKVKLVNQKVD